MSRPETTRTYYYLHNLLDNKVYSRLSIMGERTTIKTDDHVSCILYESVEEAVAIRKELGIETLNIFKLERKLSVAAIKAQREKKLKETLLNAM
jgi:hypothetical protein